MSAGRVFVAECALCHTKFTESPAECPVCGGGAIRAIRESVPSPEAIPEPVCRKTPPPKVARRPAPLAAAPKAFPAGKRVPPRGADGRFLPRKKAPSPPVAPLPAATDAKARLEAAMEERREATRAYFAALRRKSAAEAALRSIRAEIRREAMAKRTKSPGLARRKGALRSFLDAIAGFLPVFAVVFGK